MVQRGSADLGAGAARNRIRVDPPLMVKRSTHGCGPRRRRGGRAVIVRHGADGASGRMGEDGREGRSSVQARVLRGHGPAPLPDDGPGNGTPHRARRDRRGESRRRPRQGHVCSREGADHLRTLAARAAMRAATRIMSTWTVSMPSPLAQTMPLLRFRHGQAHDAARRRETASLGPVGRAPAHVGGYRMVDRLPTHHGSPVAQLWRFATTRGRLRGDTHMSYAHEFHDWLPFGYPFPRFQTRLMS